MENGSPLNSDDFYYVDMTTVAEAIQGVLTEKLNAEFVEVKDDSARHAGHQGGSSGKGHFNALIIAHIFEKRSLVDRHKLVYGALEDFMNSAIHALSMRTFTPDEWRTMEKKRKREKP